MKSKKSTGRIIFEILNSCFLIFFAFIMLFPFLNVISVSLLPVDEYLKGGIVLFPRKITLSSYQFLFNTGTIPRAYLVTIFVTVVGTMVNLAMTCFTAYAMSKKYLPGRNFIMIMVLITMYFGGGIIPNYLLLKQLGMINSLWALIIPNALNMWYMIIMRNYFESIPQSLEEAAQIDGCSHIGILFRIILPVSKASLATIGLFYAVGHWNAFFNCIMFINSKSKWTLQVVLREIVLDSNTQALLIEMGEAPPLEVVKMAAIIVTALPILLVYPFIQKYFVTGVMIGSVKG